MPVGAIRSIGAHGLSTPADISVAGFDGIDLPWLVGTLTTIDQRGQEKGRTIADMVTSALARTRENREHSFTLVQGTSTDPPRPTPTRDICLTLPPPERSKGPRRRRGPFCYPLLELSKSTGDVLDAHGSRICFCVCGRP